MNNLQKHVMIDIETLACTPDAVILEIGAVAAATDTFGNQIGEIEVLASIGIRPDQLDRRIDTETVRWWLSKPGDLRSVVLAGIVPLKDALVTLREAIREQDPATNDEPLPKIWANSPTFDLAILRHAFMQNSVLCPWTYRQECDYRTLRALLPEKMDTKPSEAHNAVSDARAQMKNMLAVLRFIRQDRGKQQGGDE